MTIRKDHSEHLDNYSLKIPKDDINKLVRKELDKIYPSFQDLKNIRKELRELNRKINEIVRWVKLIEQAMERPREKNS